MEKMAAIAERGAPVHAAGDTGVSVALAYSNHRSIAPHVDSILAKKNYDVRFGRAFIFCATQRPTFPICNCLRWP